MPIVCPLLRLAASIDRPNDQSMGPLFEPGPTLCPLLHSGRTAKLPKSPTRKQKGFILCAACLSVRPNRKLQFRRKTSIFFFDFFAGPNDRDLPQSPLHFEEKICISFSFLPNIFANTRSNILAASIHGLVAAVSLSHIQRLAVDMMTIIASYLPKLDRSQMSSCVY